MFEMQPRPEWQRQAACRGYDTGLWYSTAPAEIRSAQDRCDICPVIDDCRAHAFGANARGHPEVLGRWAGLSERERSRARRRWRQAQQTEGAEVA